MTRFLVDAQLPRSLADLLQDSGNIHNRELLHLFQQRVDWLAELFDDADYVEMTRMHLIVHNPGGDQ